MLKKRRGCSETAGSTPVSTLDLHSRVGISIKFLGF